MRRYIRSIPQRLLINRNKTRNHWVIFVISFVLASTFWFLVNLNQTYVSDIYLPAKIDNVPDDIQIDPVVFPDVEANVEGMGGVLMSYILNFQRDTLRFRYGIDAQKGYIIPQDYESAMRNTIKGLNVISIITPDSLKFEVEKKVTKKVPVRSRITIRLASAHLLESDPVLYPDSVRVVGPERILDTVRYWPTQVMQTPRLKSERVLPVRLLDTISHILIEPSTVYYQVKPKLYTQRDIKVPIVITNVPEDREIKLSHTELIASCLVPMDYYEMADNESWTYTIPYEELEKGLPYILPYLTFFPERIKVLYTKPAKISYVIVIL